MTWNTYLFCFFDLQLCYYCTQFLVVLLESFGSLCEHFFANLEPTEHNLCKVPGNRVQLRTQYERRKKGKKSVANDITSRTIKVASLSSCCLIFVQQIKAKQSGKQSNQEPINCYVHSSRFHGANVKERECEQRRERLAQKYLALGVANKLVRPTE